MKIGKLAFYLGPYILFGCSIALLFWGIQLGLIMLLISVLGLGITRITALVKYARILGMKESGVRDMNRLFLTVIIPFSELKLVIENKI